MVNENDVAIRLDTAFANIKLEYREDGNKDVSPLDGEYTAFREIIPRYLANIEAEWKYPRYLACWTTSATFQLDGKTQSLNGHERLRMHGMNLIIWDADGVRAGSIMLDKTFGLDLVKEPRSFEFILVARSRRSKEVSHKSYFDENVYIDREWCQLNIMLIEKEGEVAQRFGVGIIQEDAWLGAKPRTIFIKIE